MLTSHTLNRAPPPDAGLGFAAGNTAAGVLDFGSTLGDPAEDDVWQAPSPSCHRPRRSGRPGRPQAGAGRCRDRAGLLFMAGKRRSEVSALRRATQVDRLGYDHGGAAGQERTQSSRGLRRSA